MLLSLAMILNKMPYADSAMKCSNERCISGVAAVNGSLSDYDESTLYVVRDTFFNEDDFLLLPKNLLIVSSGPEFELHSYSVPASKMWTVLDVDIDVEELAGHISKVIGKYNRLGDKLLHAAVEEDSIERMADILSGFVGYPVSLYDSSLKVIALSNSDDMKEDLLWQKSIEYGFAVLPNSLARELGDYIARIEKEKKAFVFEADRLSRRFASKNIYINKKSVGVLQIVEVKKPFPNGITDLLEAVVPYFSIMLQRNALAQQNAGIREGQFIVDLIENTLTRDEDLRIRKKNIGWIDAPHYQLLLVKSVDKNSARDMNMVVCNRIMEMIPFSHGVSYDDLIIIIIKHNKDDLAKTEDNAAIVEYLRANGLYACVSNVFDSLKSVGKLKKITQKALEWYLKGEPAYPIIRFSDHAIEVVFEYVFADHDVLDFCHPAVLTLMAYDKRKQQSGLAKTLKVYLNSNSNQQETAEQLKIHRSTLGYRLRKIEELTQIDMGDADTVFQVQMSFRLLEYRKE